MFEETRRNTDSLLNRAIDLALKAHEGQFDKAGKPYIFHPLRVMNSCQSEDERIVAVLHDIVEDTTVTLDELRKNGFGEDIVEAVDAVTRRKNESKADAIQRTASNKIATVVKLADIEDNMNLSRLPEITQKDLQRNEKYAIAKNTLLEAKNKREIEQNKTKETDLNQNALQQYTD